MTRFHIDKNWYFRQESTINDIAKEYLPVGQFPTVQWMDLLHHKLIPDPYIDTNEIEDFWVNDADWTYKTSFDVADPGTKAVDLVFEGLDTVVDVFLNGEHILFSKDMFLSHRLNIKNKLSDCNELVLKFKAANKFAEQERCKQGWKPTEGDDTTMGGHSRLWLRKAQYSWGWDWGPCCTSSGPWKPIYLEFYETRIEDAHIVGQVDKNLNANIMVSGSVIGNTSARSCPNVEVIIKDPSGNLIYNKKVTVSSSGQFESSFDIVDPKLWFPFTYGSQPLYEISIQAQESNSEKLKKNIGLRRLELNQDSLEMEQGNSFTFVINNIPVFCGGSNWIPDEFFLPKTTEKRYRDWLNLMKQGNQNMVRVWGGGIIEQDQFYNICDELGILVWQDFLFACGNYPAYDEFTSLVKLEASQQVKRIRHHPSLVILAGNNEDYMLAELFG